jgi:hypothetical protein
LQSNILAASLLGSILFKNCDCQFHPLAPVFDSSPQEQGSQVLLDGARTDAQLPGDFFITAASHQQFENLLISRRNLHAIHIHRTNPPSLRAYRSPTEPPLAPFSPNIRHMILGL